MLFTTALRRHIRDSGTTQAEIARKLGVTTTTVYYWASGRARPSIDNLKAMEIAMGLQPGTLMVACAYEAPNPMEIADAETTPV